MSRGGPIVNDLADEARSRPFPSVFYQLRPNEETKVFDAYLVYVHDGMPIEDLAYWLERRWEQVKEETHAVYVATRRSS